MRRRKDKQIELLIGQVLRAGMLISCFVTLAGLILYLLHHPFATPNYRIFHPINKNLLHPGDLLPEAFRGDSEAIIQFGILLLIATPVARVAFLVGAFALERDRIYVAVSSVVLAILLYSIIFSR